jgi:hypothetical protein
MRSSGPMPCARVTSFRWLINLALTCALGILPSTASASPTEVCDDTPTLQQQACEIEQRALGCPDLLDRAPDLRPLIRDCRAPHRAWTWNEVWRGCRDGFAGSWSDLYEALVASPLRFLQRSAHETEAFLQNCLNTPGCREDVFRRAHDRAPTPRELQNLTDMRRTTDLFVLWRNAIARENSTGEQNRRWREQLARTRRTPLESQPPPPQDAAAAEAPGVWRAILGAYENQMQRLRCFHTEAATELACYAIFSVADPTLVAGGIAKLPRLAQALRAARPTASGAARTEAEALDFLLNPPGARAAAREASDEVRDLVRARLGPDTRVIATGGTPARGETFASSQITARGADDSFIGQIKGTYDTSQNQLHIDFMYSARSGEGVGQTLFEALLRQHPQTQRVSTTLTLDNLHELQSALAQGMSCEDAIRSTPAYKIRARAGFATLASASCSGAAFTVTR